MSLEILSWRPCHDPVSNVTIQSARSIGRCGARAPECLQPECAAKLHKYRFASAVERPFCWVDDARERHDFAPPDTDHSDRACRRFRCATAHKIEGRRPQRSIICAILSPGFAAKL